MALFSLLILLINYLSIIYFVWKHIPLKDAFMIVQQCDYVPCLSCSWIYHVWQQMKLLHLHWTLSINLQSHSKIMELYFFTNVPAEIAVKGAWNVYQKVGIMMPMPVQVTQGHQILKARRTLYIAKGYSWIYNIWGKGSSKTHHFLEVFGFCSCGEKSIMEARLIPIT